MNWDDIRVVRAVFRNGSYAAAAERLSINETTVARRLARLQDDLGFPLFDAADGRRTPTARCRELLILGETIADHARQIEALGTDEGNYRERRRIASTDSVTAEILAPNAPAFAVRNPNIELEFLASTANVRFSQWEADLAIRLARPEKGDFVMSKLADLRLCFVEPAPEMSTPDVVVCAYPADLDATPESGYLRRLGLDRSVRLVSKNVLVIRRMVLAGKCCAVLPEFACDDLRHRPDYRLTRLADKRSAWLLTQRHLRRDSTTRRVSDWLRECFEAQRR